MRSEVSHQSGSTRPGNKNYRRDNRNQPPFMFSGASPQEIEEYEREPPAPRRRRSMDQVKRVDDDEEDDDEEETLTSPIKGFDSFMMY